MVNSFEFEVGSALGLSWCADKVEVFVPAHSKIQGEIAAELPIILEVNAKHLGAARQIEIRITRRSGHTAYGSRCREAVRVSGLVRQNDAGLIVEIKFERGIEFKESTKLPFPNIIEPSPKGMVASSNREIVFELILLLVRLLRHVCIRAEADAGWEGKQWNLCVCINQVIPVLIPDRSGIHYRVAQRRIESEVAKLESVFREVTLSQIISVARLIVFSEIFLVAVADEHAVLRVEGVINSNIHTRVLIWQRYDRRRHSAEACDEQQFCKRICHNRD